MSLGERLLKYAETVITLSKALEETKEHIRDIRGVCQTIENGSSG